MDTSFTFTLAEAPAPYAPVNYNREDGLSLSVSYGVKQAWEPSYKISVITIVAPLPENTAVPTAMGAAGPRGLIRNKTLQIDFTIDMPGTCKSRYGIKILPEISIGDTATLTVNGLTDDGSVNLRISSFTLTINKQRFTITPTRYVDNRITHGSCDFIQSGGRRMKRRANVTKKARRNRRRQSRRA